MKAEAKGDGEDIILQLHPYQFGGTSFLYLTRAEARHLRDSLTAVLAEGDNRV